MENVDFCYIGNILILDILDNNFSIIFNIILFNIIKINNKMSYSAS